jgi:hypothetical protein
MFEVGDKVMIKSFNPPLQGVVILYYFDEGNVWVVEVDGARFECCDDELVPA